MASRVEAILRDERAAAKVAAVARCLNNGQSCIAAKRFIVHASVAADIER